MSASPAWIIMAALVAGIALYLVLRIMRRDKIARQQRHVEAWEDACQAHPGMYEADLERERAKLEQMRK